MQDIKMICKGLHEAECMILAHVPPRYRGGALYGVENAQIVLKEKAPGRAIVAGDHDSPCGDVWYVCPGCRIAIDKGDRFCRFCGKELEWNA